LAAECAAQQPDASGDPAQPRPVGLGERLALHLLPGSRLYPPNTASPFELGFGVQLSRYSRVGIDGSGDSRVGLKLGGVLGLLRIAPAARPRQGLQLDLESGFSGQFDNDYGQDSIGWDGYAGVSFTYATGRRWAFKGGLFHTSSHVGDELMERTEWQRLDYIREELRAAVSFRVCRQLRTYAEGGWGFGHLDPELQAPWRGQLGVVYEVPDGFWGGRAGWYAAADLSATEERQWRVDVALQAGLLVASAGRSWRLGIEFYDGRPPLGEFFRATETHLAFGLWIDL